ncbi:MAG: NADH-quinone oxidoreductase subunit C [Bacteroidota bacterium]
MALAIERVTERIKETFGEDILDVTMNYDIMTYTLKRERIIEVIQFLFDDAEMRFKFLTTMCGIHFPNEKNQLGVIYQLHNMVDNVRIRLKIFFPLEDPVVPTLTNVYPCSNWMEREAFDFFGIKFSGHPKMTRIYNVDEMDYHPLRKEYALEDATREDKDDSMFGRA